MGCVESLEKSYHDIGMPNQNNQAPTPPRPLI